VSAAKIRKQGNGNKKGKKKPTAFDAKAFLNSAGVARTMVEFGQKATLFSQGDPCKNIMYIQKGGVQISVVSKIGREAVVAMLGVADFIGDGGLAGQPMRMTRATAVTPVTVLVIDLPAEQPPARLRGFRRLYTEIGPSTLVGNS
jgi:CRP-like cAMP-binding protein